MDQTIIENGNNVESIVYKNRINNSVQIFTDQIKNKKNLSATGKIIGKGDYEFKLVDGKLIQVIDPKLMKPLSRIISSLERDGLVESAEIEQSSIVMVNEFATEEASL